MNALSALVAAVVISVGNAAVARSYVPIGTGAASSREFMAVKPADRPNLPGMRPVEIELLEDAVRRKMPHSVGNSRAKAQASIVRNSLRNPVKQSHMLGILAEAVFLEVNSKWGYVRSPNASQHDVYTWLPGSKTPFTAQIKTHVSGDPLVYAADMLKDHRSALFVVPDDHVQALKAHWSSQLQAETLAGRTTNAIEAGRQLARIQGTAAYVGGREGTRQLLEAVGPDFLHKEEDAALQGETRRIGDAIKSRQTI